MVTALALILHHFHSFQTGVFGDDAEYTILARSFVYGPHFGLINVIGPPAPTRYPFGFPLLLSVFVRAFPRSPEAVKALSTLATMANGALLFWGWRGLTRGASYGYALCVVALYLLSPLVVGQARMVMSEPVFTTGCLLCLLLTERMARGRGGRLGTFWLALCLLLTAFVRTIGVVLIPVIFGYLLWRRGRVMLTPLALTLAQMALLIGLLLLVTPLGVHDLLPLEYAHQFHGVAPGGQASETHLGVRLVMALRQYLGSDIAQTVVPLGGGARESTLMSRLGTPGLAEALDWLIAGLILLGGARWARREGIGAFLIFAVAYFGAILLWPWRGPRFLYPVQPQFAFGLIMGIEAVVWAATVMIGSLETRRRMAAVAVAALTAVVGGAMVLKDHHLDGNVAFTGDLTARTSWLRTHAPPSAVLMTDNPQTDYLYSGLKTAGLPLSYASPQDMEAAIRAAHVSYVLVAPEVIWQGQFVPHLAPFVARLDAQAQALVAQGHLRLAATSPADGVKIYQTVPTP